MIVISFSFFFRAHSFFVWLLKFGQYYMPIWFGAPNPNIPTVGDLLLHKGSVFGSLPLRLCVTRNG